MKLTIQVTKTADGQQPLVKEGTMPGDSEHPVTLGTLVAHAFLTLEGHESGEVVYDLSEESHVRNLIEEIRTAEEWPILPVENTDDPYWTVVIKLKPKGYAATLPEFDGW